MRCCARSVNGGPALDTILFPCPLGSFSPSCIASEIGLNGYACTLLRSERVQQLVVRSARGCWGHLPLTFNRRSRTEKMNRNNSLDLGSKNLGARVLCSAPGCPHVEIRYSSLASPAGCCGRESTESGLGCSLAGAPLTAKKEPMLIYLDLL